MKRPKYDHPAEFKTQVAIAALKGDETLSALAERFDVRLNQIMQWKRKLYKNAVRGFSAGDEKKIAELNLKELYEKIGEQLLIIDFLSHALGSLNELNLEHPFAGSPTLSDLMKFESHETGRRHINELMIQMDEEALYPSEQPTIAALTDIASQ